MFVVAAAVQIASAAVCLAQAAAQQVLDPFRLVVLCCSMHFHQLQLHMVEVHAAVKTDQSERVHNLLRSSLASVTEEAS